MKINLRDVIEQCERAIYWQENGGRTVQMTEAEKEQFRKDCGNADIAIGDYAIRKVRNRDDE